MKIDYVFLNFWKIIKCNKLIYNNNSFFHFSLLNENIEDRTFHYKFFYDRIKNVFLPIKKWISCVNIRVTRTQNASPVLMQECFRLGEKVLLLVCYFFMN